MAFNFCLSVDHKALVDEKKACVDGEISRAIAFFGGEAARRLVRSRVEFHSRLRRSRISSCAARNIARSQIRPATQARNIINVLLLAMVSSVIELPLSHIRSS